MQLGVGTSLLQAQMVQKGGYQRILSLDISSVAVKHMQEVHSHIPQLTYKVADARLAGVLLAVYDAQCCNTRTLQDSEGRERQNSGSSWH